MKKILVAGIFVILLSSLSACGSKNSKIETNQNDKTTNSSVSQKNSSTPSSKQSPSYYDETTKVFTYKFASLSVTDVQLTTGTDGDPSVTYPLVKVRFTVTNKTNQHQNVQELVQTLVSVKQSVSDGVSNSLNFGSASDYETDPSNLRATLAPNATVSGYFPYKITDTTNPIIIEYHTATDVNMASSMDEIIKTIEFQLNK